MHHPSLFKQIKKCLGNNHGDRVVVPVSCFETQSSWNQKFALCMFQCIESVLYRKDPPGKSSCIMLCIDKPFIYIQIDPVTLKISPKYLQSFLLQLLLGGPPTSPHRESWFNITDLQRWIVGLDMTKSVVILSLVVDHNCHFPICSWGKWQVKSCLLQLKGNHDVRTSQNGYQHNL